MSNIKNKQAFLEKEIKEYETDFINLICQRLGILIRHQFREMYVTIINACEKFYCTPEEYLAHLKSCEENSPLLEYLVLGITIGETYFFRDSNQVKLMKEFILPAIIEKKRKEGDLSLRIWSAGCSSGEEIYTVVMLLYDILPDFHHWQLSLLGTDINTRSLQKAMSGIYKEWSMRAIPEYYKRTYFAMRDNEYHILPGIKEMVNFFYLNLNDNTYPAIFNGTNTQDFIVCRNVLIYFDQNSIEKIMKKLNASLIEDGFLLLGASDPFIIDHTNLHFSSHQGSVLQRKELAESFANKSSTEKIKTTKDVKKVVFKSETIAVSKPKLQDTTITYHNFQSEVMDKLKEFDWQSVIDLIQHHELLKSPTAFSLSAKATALANLGKLHEAIKCCKKSLALEPTNKFTYLTYALALAELNELHEAESALKKTLFLDPKFVIGHFQLGLLLLRKKQKSAGLKCLKNALAIVRADDPKKIVSGSQGITNAHLNEILKHEIALYSSEETTVC